MTREFERDEFEAQLDELEASLGGAQALTAAFTGELKQMQITMADTNREVSAMRSGISGGLRRAIDGVVKDGDRLSDALRTVGQSMIDAAYSAAVRPVTNHLGGLLANGMESIIGGLMPFANGASFSQGRVTPFAHGGIVNSPTTFPMRGGTGLMGEAGPEAIMPLTRGADGRLGVRTQGGGAPVNVVMNISTNDVAGFQRSQSQIAAQIQKAISRGQRNR